MTTLDAPRGLLTPRQAAERLTVSLSTVRRLVNARELVAIRVGRSSLRFDPVELDRYLNERRTDHAA